jgi:hypothetical protein
MSERDGGEILYSLTPFIAVGGHIIQRQLRKYEIDGVTIYMARIRCDMCKRTKHCKDIGDGIPTVPSVENLTFRDSVGLHTSSCGCVHFTDI